MKKQGFRFANIQCKMKSRIMQLSLLERRQHSKFSEGP